jgi:peptide/nickel transport system ATP-binding protein
MTATLPSAELTQDTLAAVRITKRYPVSRGPRALVGQRRAVHALDEVSIALRRAEIVAVVGESGSGKTTIGRIMARLERPDSGDLLLDGTPAPTGGAHALRGFRKQVQVVFQDPYASLNTAHTVGHHLERPLLIHREAQSRREARERAIEILERVHLSPGSSFIDRYPQQLSGGQRQRVAIARALAIEPTAIIADEPVASLDVSSRLSILNLFAGIASEGASLLYITHDIASARYFADRIVVMYAGRVVEEGTAENVVSDPQHPYTRLLIDSAPDPDRRGRTRPATDPIAEVASLIDPPSGCRFHPRCPHAMAVCSEERPPAFDVGPGATAACWLHDLPDLTTNHARRDPS